MRLMRIISRYWVFLLFYGILLLVALISFYRGGSIILGGEGDYWLDFSAHLKNYFFAWQNNGIGNFNIALNVNFPNVLFFTLLQKFIHNAQIINFILIFLLYFLPFLGMILLCREFKITPFITFLVSLFYLANPFSLMFLYSLNQWNVLILFTLPLFFWVILRFYSDNFKLFFYFGLTSLLFSFVNVNPPLIAINLISVAIAVLITAFYLNKKVSLIELFKKYLLLALSFILFNAWWLANWFYILVDVQKGYTKQFAISWLRGTMEFVPVTFRIFNLTMLLPDKIDWSYNFFTGYYTLPSLLFVFSFPVFIFLYAFYKKKFDQRHLLLLALIFFLIAFLTKGIKGVFGGFYEYAVLNLPFFSIFKTAAEKWGVLYVFLFALLLALILRELRNDKYWRLVLFLFLCYLFFNTFPFISGGFISDYRFGDNITVSRKFFDKKEYQELRAQLNSGLEEYRVLSLPGSQNYQVALQISGHKFYTGNDPVFNNTNKAFIAPYNHNNQASVLFKTISEFNYLDTLGLYNIKKIVINKDAYPWFGFQEKETIAEIEKIFDEKLESSKKEVIDVYDVGGYYLPRFYIPEKVIFSPTLKQDELPIINSVTGLLDRTAFFFLNGNAQSQNEDFIREGSSEIIVVGESQSAVVEKRLREGVRELSPSWVLFPYARWKPGSFIYPLIQKKEEKIKNQYADDLELLAEQNLFFAAKRIFEIQRWEKEFDDEQFSQVLENYQKEMLMAIENLDKLTTEGRDTFMLLAKIEVSFGAHKKRLLDILKGNYEDDNHPRVVSAKSFLEKIDNELKKIVNKHFFYPKYYFEIPEEGEYEILIEKKGASPEWKIEKKTLNSESISIDSSLIESNTESWFSFGMQYFDKGDDLLSFNKPSPANLLVNEWKRFKDQKLVFQDIENLQPETTYRLTFKYKTKGGQLRVLLIEEKEEVDTTWFDKGVGEPFQKHHILIDETLEDDGVDEWKDFERIFETNRNVKVIRLSFTNKEDPDRFAEIKFKEAKIEAMIEPRVILRKIRDSRELDLPKIAFQKINPTKYIVEVERAVNPYFLIFSESFHRGWQAYVVKSEDSRKSGEIVGSYFNGEIKEKKAKEEFFDRGLFQTLVKKPLADEKHFTMNGYANSWYISPEDSGGEENYQIIIEYWPQRLFYLGILVTLVTMALALVTGFIRFSHNKD